MSLIDAYEDTILDYLTSGTWYVGLSYTTPTDAGASFTEHSGDGYARVEVLTGDWNAASGGVKTNLNPVIFPLATGSWGTITYFGLFDASTDGNLCATGVLTSSKAIANGDTPSFAASVLRITLT